MKSINVLLLSAIMLIYSCSSDDNAAENPIEEPISSVENITIDIQHIVTPIQGQPMASRMKVNMLDEKIYFQELTGSPWEENAKLWEYSVTNNEFTQKNGRGKSFSWSGWGMKLFNINGYMFHLDKTGDPDAEYYLGGNADTWAEIETTVPPHVISGDVAVSGSTAYFLGGDFTNDFTSYFAADKWYNLATFPINIASPVLTADENYVYSIGGRESQNGNSDNNYFARYSIQDNRWETLERMPHGTYGTNYGNKSLIVNDRFLIVIAYGNSANEILEIYDLKENVWKTEAINLNFSSSHVYQYNGSLYFISSSYSQQTELATFKIYKATLENLPN